MHPMISQCRLSNQQLKTQQKIMTGIKELECSVKAMQEKQEEILNVLKQMETSKTNRDELVDTNLTIIKNQQADKQVDVADAHTFSETLSNNSCKWMEPSCGDISDDPVVRAIKALAEQEK